MDVLEKTAVFREMISYNRNLHYCSCDPLGQLDSPPSEDDSILHKLLLHSGCLQFALDTPGRDPIVLSTEERLMWIALREFTEEGELRRLHLLGPYFEIVTDDAAIEDLVRRVFGAEAPNRQKARISAIIRELPKLAFGTVFQYAAMLQKCIDGRALTEADFIFQENSAMSGPSGADSSKGDPGKVKDRLLVYQAERRLLSQVREGDFDEAGAARFAGAVTKVRNYTDNPLLNMKIAYTIFTSLCVRAAIEGGLSASISYPLGDQYIREIMECHRQSDLYALRSKMYQDFIRRVRACRTNPEYSKEIRSCVEYIQMHRGDKLTIELLSDRLGYSKYYLSHRFKEEVGCSVMDYVKFVRVERAKQLLTDPKVPIESIAADLGFGSRAFFDRVFKATTGLTPAAYRKKEAIL